MRSWVGIEPRVSRCGLLVRALLLGSSLVLSGLTAAACGEADSEGDCPAGMTLTTLQAVPANADGTCVETGQRESVELCVGEERLGFEGFRCFRRLADDKQFWLMQRHQNQPAVGWALCDPANPHESVPVPCFTAECPAQDRVAPIAATCDDETIRAMWQCGGQSAWDEHCCVRPACSESGECPDGMECRSESPRAAQLCGETATGQCSCAGTPGGMASLFCFPKDE